MIFPVFTISATSVYIAIDGLCAGDSPFAVIIPVLFKVIVCKGSESPITAASPIPPSLAVIFPLLLIFLFPLTPLSYCPRSPIAPVPIFKFPVEFKLPFVVAVATRAPEPVTVILFPRVRFPPLLNTPIPPPSRKLIVRFPVVPKLTIPPSTYIPVPLFIFKIDVSVVRVVPFFTYIPIPSSIFIVPL